MKIAILTQPLHTNYGGILQCYALQTVLEAMGHRVTVVNRRFARPGFRQIVMRFASVAKCIVRKYLLMRKDIALMNPWAENYNIHKQSEAERRRNSEMQRFIHEHIHLSKPLRSSLELRKYVEAGNFECIVVGSDQVWREIYSPCIEDFFLGFLPEGDKRLKITYAASFGTADNPISSEYLENCVRLAKRFSYISVREQSGLEIMRNLFGLDAKLLLDPTLLLSADKYRFPVKEVGKGGLVSYILDETDEKNAILQDVSENLRLKDRKLRINTTNQGNDEVMFPSIEEWLSSFANADFVVTDSFHGCVFSIINHKPFIAIANKDRGLERFTSLLGTFGLMDRLVFDINEYDRRKNLLLTPVDFNEVEKEHQLLIQDSFEFLNMSLGKPLS